MEKLSISTELAPAAIGPYSQAIKYGTTVYTSGQIPLDPETGKLVEGSIEVQTRRVFDNLKAVLDSSRSSLSEVLKVTIYMTTPDDFSGMNEIFSLYFGKNKPARSCVFVTGLPKGAKIEAEAIAKCH